MKLFTWYRLLKQMSKCYIVINKTQHYHDKLVKEFIAVKKLLQSSKLDSWVL